MPVVDRSPGIVVSAPRNSGGPSSSPTQADATGASSTSAQAIAERLDPAMTNGMPVNRARGQPHPRSTAIEMAQRPRAARASSSEAYSGA
jgi:hypothetical protein